VERVTREAELARVMRDDEVRAGEAGAASVSLELGSNTR
jgi:hypothetical protein